MPPRTLPLSLTLLAFLPSCAYVQTHKNVEEYGRTFPGHQLEKPAELYRSGSTWYLAATPATFRRHHDPIHDQVFRGTHEPHMQLLSLTADAPAYHAISPHTAAVLLRPDGYADTASLAAEISRTPSLWVSSLPNASCHKVQARVAGDKAVPLTTSPTPAEIPFGYRVLSGLDLLCIDAPGTVLYNVAIPVIAPFVFFSEFLSD